MKYIKIKILCRAILLALPVCLSITCISRIQWLLWIILQMRLTALINRKFGYQEIDSIFWEFLWDRINSLGVPYMNLKALCVILSTGFCLFVSVCMCLSVHLCVCTCGWADVCVCMCVCICLFLYDCRTIAVL